MTFYLTPPTGTISLKRLTQFAYTRFTFLCKILETHGNRIELFDVVKETETVEDSECLIEGTCKDKISHTILRLACCEDKDMSEFLLTAETLLFDFRFSCMTQEEICKLFRSIDRYRKVDRLSRTESVSSILRPLFKIREHHCSWRAVVERYLTGVGYFSVPFQAVLHLVARREVSLYHGMAHVPFYRLREMVTGVFRKLLLHGLQFARPKTIHDDTRIIEVVQVLKVLFRHKYRGDLHRCVPHGLLHTQIDELVSQFPPCMSHLHRVLRRKHRLNHHARIQYTLFLKEIGLPVHEAVHFWRAEYSKTPHETSGCGHDWSTNERRYTYSIRHLYGLEGSRINYRGHSCQTLQESYHGVLDEGGCPFSHFDKQHLSQLLSEEEVQGSETEILTLQELTHFSEACKIVHHVKLKNMLKDEHLSSTCRKIASQVKCEGDLNSINTSTDSCDQLRNMRCSLSSCKRQRLSVDVEDTADKKTHNSLELLKKSDACLCDSNKCHTGGTTVLKDLAENQRNVCHASKPSDMKTTKLKHAVFDDDTYPCDFLSPEFINSKSRKHDRFIHENCSRINHKDEYNVSNSDMNQSTECLSNSDRSKVAYSLLSNDAFSKPVDFYMSYAKLLKNLKEDSIHV